MAHQGDAVTSGIDGHAHRLGVSPVETRQRQGLLACQIDQHHPFPASAALDQGQHLTTLWAGLVHDVGRVGVPTGIWDKPGPLTSAEWERVRLHSYYTERVLSQSRLLSALQDVAGGHHERVDGRGYHRGIRMIHLRMEGHLLAVADAYHAMTEPRPYRPALTAAAAAAQLRREADADHFFTNVVEVVLDAAGHAPVHAPRNPNALTDREQEVLRTMARGGSMREVATTLGIAPKTVDNHIQHIYDKIGVRSRAAATLYALEHGLFGPAAEGGV